MQRLSIYYNKFRIFPSGFINVQHIFSGLEKVGEHLKIGISDHNTTDIYKTVNVIFGTVL